MVPCLQHILSNHHHHQPNHQLQFEAIGAKIEYRYQCCELSKPEIDMAILGQPAALRRREATIEAVSGTNRKKKQRVSARSYTVFRFGDMVICKNTFIFLHAISLKHFKNLCNHFDSNGLSPRQHGNASRKRQRLCSVCHRPGHNKRSCTELANA